MGILRSAAALAIACAASACTPSIYYYQRSVLGVSAAASTPESGGHLVVGVNRKIVPIVQSAENAADGEAMSFIGCTETTIEGLFDISVKDYTATGQAAVEITKDDAQNAQLATCFGAATSAEAGR